VTNLLAFTIVGVVTGCIYAVAALGLVVTYTTAGVFNLAHGAVGMFMAFVYWELRVRHHWPTPVALIVVLFVLAPLLGAAIERTLVRRLHGSPVRVTLVVTLALLVILLKASESIWKPTSARTLSPFFLGHHVKIAGVVVTAHELITLAVAALTAAGLRLLLYHTRIGVTMRATVDDRELITLNGAHPERVSQLAWALGATLAAAAGILIAPTLTLAHLPLTLLVINGYAAAFLGRLRNLPLTFAGALILGLGEAYTIGYGSSFKLLGEMKPILPTIFLFAVIVFIPHARLRAGRIVGARTPHVPGLRSSLVGAAALVGAVAFLSMRLSEFWLFTVASAFVAGIMMLSLVLLTGYAGQVSLTQVAFVGIGALAMGRLAPGGSVLGLLMAAVMAGAVGAVIALPALRLQDLYLGLSTLAFAEFVEWYFNQRWTLDLGGLLAIHRLKVPGFYFHSEQSQLILVTVVFALAGVLVLAIRRSAYGRRLIAMSDSPIACGTIGLNLVATKTTVFAISAAIAGLAGALFGGLHTSVSAGDFVMFQSLVLFLLATIGGLTTVSGALAGGMFLVLLPELQKHIHFDNLQYFGIGLAAIFLAEDPNGFGGNLSLWREQIRAWRRRRAGARAVAGQPAVTPEGEMALT